MWQLNFFSADGTQWLMGWVQDGAATNYPVTENQDGSGTSWTVGLNADGAWQAQ